MEVQIDIAQKGKKKKHQQPVLRLFTRYILGNANKRVSLLMEDINPKFSSILHCHQNDGFPLTLNMRIVSPA